MEFAKLKWQEGLKPFSDEILQQAIVSCRDFYEMPSTLPQFIRACRDVKKRLTTFTPPESKPSNPEVAKRYLQQILANLKEKNGD